MAEIDRRSIPKDLCSILQKDYVALLGQKGIGIDTVVRALKTEQPVLTGMKFISVALPRLPGGTPSMSEFEELFLDRLLYASEHVPPEPSVSDKVKRAVQQWSTYSANSRIRKALDTLGRETSENYLVIILDELAHVGDEALKNLLLLLREYHSQRDSQGDSGEKLRFLVAGGARLWHLCYHNTPERSPFNIAKRVFLEGLSYQELQMMDNNNNLDAAIMLHSLTDGIPLLVEDVLKSEQPSDDLTPYFGHVQNHWTALPAASQALLKNLAAGVMAFPECEIDYNCPQIPIVKSPWSEAFWGGFLRLRYRQLTWRSQMHQAFVLHYMEAQGNSSKSVVIKVDLQERTTRLDKAVKNLSYRRSKQEPLEEALSLTCQTYGSELAPLLAMAQHGVSNDRIVQEVERLALLSEREWIRQLGEKAAQQQDTIQTFLLEAIVARARYFFSAQFDVFLCHNSEDKAEVKALGKCLQDAGIAPWLDAWELPPGQPWQPLLEQQITQVKAAAVFVGQHGISLWQREEMDAWLLQFKKRGCPVIPVWLASAPPAMELPPFLTNRTPVDFRSAEPDPLTQLVWGITGKKGSSSSC